MGRQAALPYGRQWVDEQDIDAVVEVLRGDWLTTGPAVDGFELGLAEHAGVRHAVAVNSGTAALHCVYAAAGVGPGNQILTTPLTFAATATAALHLGARVSFADIEPATGLIDPDAVAAVVDRRTRLVVPVDFAGHLADYASIGKLAAQAGCDVVSDAAHAFGATRGGRTSAQLADAATTSFHPVKGFTTGEGGAVLTQRSDWAEGVARFRNHGIVKEPGSLLHEGGAGHYEVQSLGLNYRLPDILCALGASQLGRFDGFLERRRAIAAHYDREFASLGAIETPTTGRDCEPSWHLYVIRVFEARRRDAFFDALREAGLGVQLHYPPVHLHPLFEDLGFRRGQFPMAEDFAARAISLPLFPAMSDDDTVRVIETVHACVRDVL
ncbi:MAG: aminotransferase class V-fold PLP-dependent enzyme [Myxococcota bacterium]|jgi:dTDP-4-amino-4,6-dideoxygalactose transaminase|nr:aminotransferase class V-fold PLP-dependent enzyme [Myxococcota bacterium]